jgi:hypothetical protein
MCVHTPHVTDTGRSAHGAGPGATDLFDFVRMPFGLRNAGMIFQWLINSFLGGPSFAFVYMDNIFVSPALTLQLTAITWPQSSPSYSKTATWSMRRSASLAAQTSNFWVTASPPQA